MFNLEPTHDWVVIEIPKEDTEEEKTTSGLFIPTDTNYKEELPSGKVVSVGPGYIDNAGNFVPTPIHIGDTVYHMPNAGLVHESGGNRYYFINYRNAIVAVERAEHVG